MLKLVRYFNCAAFFGVAISVSAVAQELPANATTSLSPEGRPGVASEVHPQVSNESAASQFDGAAGSHALANLAVQEATAEATKQIASATRWQVGLAALGTVAAIVGAIAVIRNLLLVREANAILQAEQRTWLSVEVLDAVEDFAEYKDHFAADVNIAIENIGPSPALNVSYFYEVRQVGKGSGDPVRPFEEFVARHLATYDPAKLRNPIAIFPSKKFQPSNRPFVECIVTSIGVHPPKLFQFNIVALYKSGLSNETFHTAMSYTFMRSTQRMGQLSGDADELSSEASRTLKVRQLHLSSVA